MRKKGKKKQSSQEQSLVQGDELGHNLIILRKNELLKSYLLLHM